jgi:diacylglycerol kinase (ATP)
MWILIANPNAGLIRRRGREVFSPLRDEAARRGIKMEIQWSESSAHGEALARAAVARHARGVSAAGGDGTINRVACGLIGSKTALGLIPGGTVNVLARALGSGLTLARATHTLFTGSPREFWPGLVNDRPFLTMTGIGLDAAIVAAADSDPRLKKSIGRLSYPWTGVRRFSAIPKPPITGLSLPHAASLVVAGRTPLYGGSFPLMPDAQLWGRTLGLFAAHAFSRRGLLHATASLALSAGRPASSSSRRVTRAMGEVFEFAAAAECDYQVDGEWIGRARAFTIAVSAAPLLCIV